MPSARTVLATAAVALAAPGCGGGAATPPHGATVVIDQRHVSKPDDAIYVEGSYGYVQLEDEGGKRVFRVRDDRPTARRAVAPGDYFVFGFQRACEANCGAGLDPPSDRCREAVTIHPRETLRLFVRHRVGHHCTIGIGRPPSA